MRRIAELFSRAKVNYDRGGNPFAQTSDLVHYCIDKLHEEAEVRPQANLDGKLYSVFVGQGERLSRPFLPDLFLNDPQEFAERWRNVQRACNGATHTIELGEGPEQNIRAVNAVLYTAVTAFSACFDLWKPGSRKTPGTLFEVLMGSWFSVLLPEHRRSKAIPLPDGENISTDIVFTKEGGPNFVFPAKITTRERIVQPFAHQRILNSIFGDGFYRSLLICMSETQRDDEDVTVNEICVPGTVRLFQRHLATIAGIYYLDPPHRYLEDDVTAVLEVTSLGVLMTGRLSQMLG